MLEQKKKIMEVVGIFGKLKVMIACYNMLVKNCIGCRAISLAKLNYTSLFYGIPIVPK